MLKFAAVALSAATIPAFAQTDGGTYSVAGTNPDGSAYTGRAEITWTGTDCKMTWMFDNGKVDGTCLQVEGVLATSYLAGDVLTLVLYRVRADGVLNGTWSVVGIAGTGVEVLTPQ